MRSGTARRLIAEAELRAERTAAIVRLVVAALLFTGFVLAVSGQAPEMRTALARQIEIAFAVLVAYVVIGVAALALARPERFRPWMPWLLATLDTGFILANVALNLRNLELPANYLPVLPVLWLAPLVLAFPAMRFDPWLQAYTAGLLTAGLAATAATLGGGLALVAPPPPAELTFLFDMPPNIMRLVMLMLAGLVLVTAVARSRSLLRSAVEETVRRAALTRYLPPRIGAWLAETSVEELRQGRRQRVAVLFADIRGFTTRAETMEPDALGRFVAEFRRRVTVAADAHGGVIDKFIGDAAMIVFGVPHPGPADARAALDCARALLASIEAWSRESGAAGVAEGRVEIGMGLHWGEVFCGAVGDDRRLEFTVLGDTVNVAARLEEEAKAASVPLVLSREVLDAAGEPVEGWRRLPSQTLRGRRGMMELFAPPAGWAEAPPGVEGGDAKPILMVMGGWR